MVQSKYDIEYIKSKILELADSNNPYSQEDFDKEFSNKTNDIDNSFKINVNFVNKSNNPNPDYETNGSSGLDLRANLTETLIIEPNKRAIIPTGLYFSIPENFEIQIRPRSGLAAKNGVTVLNSPGTIDADYRGEIKVILINHGDTPFTICNGDRIAQAVFSTVTAKNIINLIRIEEISSDTTRGSNGFGSTGVA